MELSPSWIGVAITVGGIIFAAGGFYAGSLSKGDTNAQAHQRFQKDIDHLDSVKQSRAICDERFGHMTQTLHEIKEDQKEFIVEWRAANGNRGS